MIKKYNGEIPFWLSKKRSNIIYLCSSNKNMENYYAVLSDISKNRLLKLEKNNDEFEMSHMNYDLLSFFKKDDKFVIFISLDILLSDFSLEANNILFKIGEKLDLKQLEANLLNCGFEKNYLVENRMQYSQRGDILDIFSMSGDNPIRIEFFGDEIDRITYFDIESQTSIEKLEEVEMYIDNNKEKKSFFELLKYHNVNYQMFFENKELLNFKLEEKILSFDFDEFKSREEFEKMLFNSEEIEIQRFSTEELKTFENYDEVKKLSKNIKINILTEEEARYKEIFLGTSIKIKKYPLYEGYKTEKEIFLTDRELKGIRVKRSRKEEKKLRYREVSQIHENDYVIHENYGVGIYLGVETIDFKDYLKIKYADEDKLFVPIENISKIEKYLSTPGAVPSIYHLGTRGFKRKREKLREDMMLLAKEIIAVQAKRSSGNGFAFSKDTIWQEEFEEGFPYQETESQKKAIEDVKLDMESNRVMNRLICGDVGYGKTEVAIRASFKAIMDGKQVALLVPTTVLAEQHFERFSERFKNYPISLESISRVKSPALQKEILKKLKSGSLDMIIGTHRLLSEDVEFKDLGLLIIDEEQKFGVKAKEKLKKSKGVVDLLALTATPIPRTLNMSLMGIMDLSVIDTPPQGRKAVETIFIEDKAENIKKAIMSEISREGQVYYIYNVVKRIEQKTEELRKLFKNYVKLDFIHGQMNAKDIKKKLKSFENMDTDVLVATTIIENGIDIENANTMIIEGVEKLGLSQLYQLRGRIGRGTRKSYCYLIDKEFKSKKAKEREESLRESGDAGGLQLSLEDMKIRGVGEILGDKQHGSIETFGYTLYLKMLNEEINRLKGIVVKKLEDVNIRLNFPKFIPDSYIEKTEKLTIYKRALELESLEDVKNLKLEVIDRFGKMPKEAEGFFRYIEIKMICLDLNIIEIDERESRLYIKFQNESDETKEDSKQNIRVDRIIEMISDRKLEYLASESTIIYKGKIDDFFEEYLK